MTILLEACAPNKYFGLSSDAKPTGIPVGSTFFESDTGNTYTAVSPTSWVLLPGGSSALGDVSIDQTTPGTTNRVVTQETDVITQTPTITAGAYTAKDAVGGKLTFAGVGNKGLINSLVISDKTTQAAELVLVLFDQDFTPTADNAPFDPSDADLANCGGFIRVIASDYQAFADNGVATLTGIGLPYKLAAAGTSLYGQLMCTGTPTYASTSDLTAKLGVIED